MRTIGTCLVKCTPLARGASLEKICKVSLERSKAVRFVATSERKEAPP
jgi:hypothetical protein